MNLGIMPIVSFLIFFILPVIFLLINSKWELLWKMNEFKYVYKYYKEADDTKYTINVSDETLSSIQKIDSIGDKIIVKTQLFEMVEDFINDLKRTILQMFAINVLIFLMISLYIASKSHVGNIDNQANKTENKSTTSATVKNDTLNIASPKPNIADNENSLKKDISSFLNTFLGFFIFPVGLVLTHIRTFFIYIYIVNNLQKSKYATITKGKNRYD